MTLSVFLARSLNQISTKGLLPLNCLEERFEVTSTEAGKVVSLDDFNEDSRTIHEVLSRHISIDEEIDLETHMDTYLGEQLKKVATLVEVNQDIQASNRLKVLLEDETGFLETGLHINVICLGHLDELDTSSFEVGDIPDDVVGVEGDMLHAGTVVKVDVLLDLGLLFTLGRLVDGHLDNLIW